MNPRVEKLLKPVSESQPCGPDLSYDPAFDSLEALVLGKPEIEMGSVVRPAEPPNWREVAHEGEALLGRTKHLRAAVIVACAWLKEDGFAGFRDGLQLIRGLLEAHWDRLYPALDPDDANDPTQRLNILRALTAPRGSVTGWLKVIEYLYDTPLGGKGAPLRVTFGEIQAARERDPAATTGGAGGPDFATLTRALRTAGPGPASEANAALEDAIAAVSGIDHFLTSTLGAGVTISFDGIAEILGTLTGVLKPYLDGAGDAGVAGPDAAAAGDSPSPADAAGAPGGLVQRHEAAAAGPIRNRADVMKALDRLCDYYRQAEPGSPVPYLLLRARKLAAMNFVEAMAELNLATTDTLRPSLGSAIETEAAPS